MGIVSSSSSITSQIKPVTLELWHLLFEVKKYALSILRQRIAIDFKTMHVIKGYGP
jgi:hypothetical protein